jgi:hypothetical protein
VLVWNRQRSIKDPNTGKRVSRPNPEAKWIRTEVPELRIVDDALWQLVKLRQAGLAKQFGPTTLGVRAARAKRLNGLCRPAFLLSGLLICGCCRGRYGIVVNDRNGCLGQFRRGSAIMAAPSAVARSSGASWRASPTPWSLPKPWRSRCAPVPTRPTARTMSAGR